MGFAQHPRSHYVQVRGFVISHNSVGNPAWRNPSPSIVHDVAWSMPLIVSRFSCHDRPPSRLAPMLICGILADKAPSSVRDQIFDHQSSTVRYYLDREVQFNTIAAFLVRPSDDIVQKLARLMTLTVDPNAPTKLSPELSKQVANSKRVLQLSRESKELTEKLNATDCFRRPGSDIFVTPTRTSLRPSLPIRLSSPRTKTSNPRLPANMTFSSEVRSSG